MIIVPDDRLSRIEGSPELTASFYRRRLELLSDPMVNADFGYQMGTEEIAHNIYLLCFDTTGDRKRNRGRELSTQIRSNLMIGSIEFLRFWERWTLNSLPDYWWMDIQFHPISQLDQYPRRKPPGLARPSL
jgi:hypothetical protein